MKDKILSIIQNSYKAIAYIAIIFTLVLINYDHIITDTKLETLKVIIWIIIGTIILVTLNKLVINKIKEKKLLIMTVIGLIVFLILEIISYIFFKVEYNWDFKWLMETALDLAQTGNSDTLYYFKIFPNNIGALVLITIAVKLFNANIIGAYVLNITFIFLAALFTVLVARKIGGEKLGLNAMILLLGFMPMYLNTPIVYTDSLSIAFPIATLYFWIIAKEKKEKSKKKYYLFLTIVAILGVLAYYIKANSAIVFVAIIIDSIFTNKKMLKDSLLLLLIFILLMLLGNIFIEKYLIQDKRKNDMEYPLTHYLMIGVGLPTTEGGTAIGYGAYSEIDAHFTSVQPTYQAKKEANIKVLKERLENFGFYGYIKFLLKKFNYVWNDGTYYVLSVIGWDTINTKSILYRVVLGDLSEKFVRPYMTYYNNVIFILLLYLSIKNFIDKNDDDIVRITGISIVGIAIFLLFWEARSRYVYILMPLFCILGAKGINEISNNSKLCILKNIKFNKE